MSAVEIRPGRIINLEIYDNPNSKATIFLLHGIAGSSAQWREQIKILQKDYKLIVPDLLGHGKSAKPKPNDVNPYTFKEYSQDMEVIFNQYAGQQNIICGHSYGGALALFLAAQHLERVKKLILIAPAPCEAMPKVPFIFSLPVFLLKLLQPLLDKFFQKLGFDSSANPTLKAEESRTGLKNDMGVLKAMWQGCKEVTTIDPSHIKIPTLIIAGESDKIIPFDSVKNFYERLPHFQLAVIQKAGHMVMLEQPEEVNNLITQFLKK